MSFVTSVLAETGHAVTQLPFPPMVYGAIAIVIFATLGFVMFSYQNVSRRHGYKSTAHNTENVRASQAAHEISPGGPGH